MSKIGPKEMQRRVLALRQAREAEEAAKAPDPSPPLAVDDPAAQEGHTTYMRTYMQRWRRGEVGHKHKPKEE